MKENNPRVSRRWRTATVLALGIVVGTVLVAQPAGAHFLPSISHIWSHIKPKADVRYANAVRGTDKAKNADKLDGKNSTVFLPGAPLPPGKTLTGSFSVRMPPNLTYDLFTFEFAARLSAAPTPHYVMSGSTDPNCPGDATNPTADPGHLCIYEETSINRSATTCAYDPVTYSCPDARKDGFALALYASDTSLAAEANGAWAVRAPLSGGSARSSGSTGRTNPAPGPG